MGFRAIGYSKTGNSHLTKGLKNQDRYHFEHDDEWFYCALADGVSSAPMADKGADFAIETIRSLALSLRSTTVSTLTKDDLRTKVVRGWRSRVKENYSDYATTINFVIGLSDVLIVGRIGDGAIVLRTNVNHIVWNANDLCCAETPALSNVVHREDVEIALLPRQGPSTFYMMSDGIAKEIEEGSEMALLSYLTEFHDKAHQKVSKELLEWMKFLDERNADDKSICVIQAGE